MDRPVRQRPPVDGLGRPARPPAEHGAERDGRFSITNLRYAPAIQNWLPVEVRNALRLGLAELRVTWTARWQSPADQVYRALGTLNARLNFTLTFKDSAPLTLGALQAVRPFTENCSKLGVDSVRKRSSSTGARRSARNFADEINRAALGTGNGAGTYTSDQSGFTAAVAAATTAVNVRLRELQDETLKDFLAPNGQLTSGTGPATNVYDAADRVGGAQTLLDGYIALGLPQALSTDDGLRALVAGERRTRSCTPTATARRPTRPTGEHGPRSGRGDHPLRADRALVQRSAVRARHTLHEHRERSRRRSCPT